MSLIKYSSRNLFFFLIILWLMMNLIGCSTSTVQEYQLIIDRLGQGTFSPESGAKYKSGTVVSLTAIPAEGNYFYRWEGPDGALVSDNKVTMDKDISLKAYFFKYGIIGRVYKDNQPSKLSFHLYLEFSYHIGDSSVAGIIRSAIIKPRSDGSFFVCFYSNDLPIDDVTSYIIELKDETETISLYRRQNVSIQEGLNDLGIIELN